MASETTLADLGERTIIEEILKPRYAAGGQFGDDCAVMAFPPGAGYIVATTDPCPLPAATILGYDDFYYWGWLLGTINLSDLAAAGATPSGILSSLVLPREFTVDSFVRILDGLDDCARIVGTAVVGGNLKEAPRVDISASAFGYTDGPPLSRTGASVGDAVLVLGAMGEFWAAFLSVRGDLGLPEPLLDQCIPNVLRPQAKVALGGALRTAGLLTAAMDNSDGLYPSLATLCQANAVGIMLDMDSWLFDPPVTWVASKLGIDPHRLALGWGDWQLVVTAGASNVPEVFDVCAEIGVRATVIGSVVEGTSVRASRNGFTGGLMGLDSERFTADSWFTSGIDSYIQSMMRDSLLRP